MPHVLFVTGEYPPMSGGVGAYTAKLGAELATRGLTVSVLTSVHAKEEATARIGVTVHPIMRRWGWPIWPCVAQLATRLGASWIHVQYQTAAFGMHPAVNLAPLWWKRKGLCVAWTYHDLLVPYLFPKAGARLRTWVTEKPAVVCDLTIVTNEGDRLQLESKTRRLCKIPIGSNIRTEEVSGSQRLVQRNARGYTAGDLVVGYFGFLNRSKGGRVLVRAVERLRRSCPRVHLLMIGERVGASDPTNYAYLQEVERLIGQLGLQDHVKWTGRQSDDEVSADLAACDILLMPYEDGASLRRGTLMAGLAHGCAIVTTAPQTPLPELVNERDVLYIPPGDSEAAAAAVQRIATDDELAQTLRANARARSRLFAWESIAEQHVALYTSGAAEI